MSTEPSERGFFKNDDQRKGFYLGLASGIALMWSLTIFAKLIAWLIL